MPIIQVLITAVHHIFCLHIVSCKFVDQTMTDVKST